MYIGEFKEGLRNGNGMYSFKDRIYDGEFLNDEMTGQGKIIFNEENIEYVGEF